MDKEKKSAISKDTTKLAASPLTVKPKNVKLVPPDGAWGWVIILATSINLVSYNQNSFGNTKSLNLQ